GRARARAVQQRVAFAAQTEGIAVSQPVALDLLELAVDAGVEAHEHQPAPTAVVVGHPAPDDAVAPGALGPPAEGRPRVGAPHVRAERTAGAVAVAGVVEVVGGAPLVRVQWWRQRGLLERRSVRPAT